MKLSRNKVFAAIGGVIVLWLGSCYVVYGGGEHQGPGVVTPTPVPAAVVSARRTSVEAGRTKQVLFGDLHVHTTYSADAFLRSLPLLHGEGVHPPADACDYARFCSGLDFFALTDHAEALTPAHWNETKESVRQCNAVARDPQAPDVVAFTGFEWTQVGRTAAEHYGHKNVIFRETDEAHLPTRPIAAGGAVGQIVQTGRALTSGVAAVPIVDFPQRQPYKDLLAFLGEMRDVPPCPTGVDVRALPANCREAAATPRDLFTKLDQWGFDAIVIPHGTTWGFYTPGASYFGKQLTAAQQDPARQFLFEVYSGHGNSEQYKTWKPVNRDEQGNESCPEPTSSYEPCCHRAGELVRARCDNAKSPECEKQVSEAKQRYVAAGASGHLTVPWAKTTDWGNCGQCTDCFLPSFNYRPGGAAQVALATTDFSDPAKPKNHPFGLIASSDNHSARPGTGYKEYARRKMTEATGARDEATHERVFANHEPAKPGSTSVEPFSSKLPPWRLVDLERQSSFFLTGGLVAVHSEGRTRGAIWDAMARREVYATSGPKILLWFDIENSANGLQPMGSEAVVSQAPKFRVRAAGSFVQKPGCPPSSTTALSPERLANLCAGECENPSDKRLAILRIEVIRIRPQKTQGEDIGGLIEDVWKSLPCPEGAEVCEVTFDDPELLSNTRAATYYVRAIQEPTPAVNGGGLRCEKDSEGRCVSVKPCYGDYKTKFEDDCLEKVEERAWSSPIFVTLQANK